jgi:RNA polymerase sigma-70 factor (ECF subfamily)
VAVNRCRKHHQQNLRHVSEPLPETAHSAIGDPYGYALQCEAADQIGVALNTLSEMHREVVVLHELHGLTYAECANVLNVPVGTVKSRLSNAFRHLRQRLSSYVEERQPTPVVRPAKEVRHEPV